MATLLKRAFRNLLDAFQPAAQGSCDYNDRPLRPAAPWHTPELWMFIVVPILDFRNQQGHNSDALLGGEIRSNEASGGHFGHGTRRFREQSETHPLTFSCLRGFLGPPPQESTEVRSI